MERACCRGKSRGYYEELKVDVLEEEEEEEEEVEINDDGAFEVERVVHKRKRKVIFFFQHKNIIYY